MSYRLKKRKRVADDLRRVVREQTDKALAGLTARNADKDDAIHDARVCFKKIRAVLRLTRDQLSGSFKQENIFYRDLGRRLSGVRNNVSLLEAFEKLKQHYRGQIAPDALTGQRRALAESNARQSREKGKAIAEVSRSLSTGRGRVQRWPLADDGFGSFAPGLKRTYKQGRDRFATVLGDPTVEKLHEWRKRVKDLWYQVRLLNKVWPAEMQQLANELEKLGDYLSDHHDLAMLRQAAGDHAKQTGDEGTKLEAFLALIDQRRAELRLKQGCWASVSTLRSRRLSWRV